MSPNFNTTGIIMISLALLCDAVIGNVQEKAMKEFSAPNAEVVLYSYSIGFIYLFIILLATNNLLSGIQFCAMVRTLVELLIKYETSFVHFLF